MISKKRYFLVAFTCCLIPLCLAQEDDSDPGSIGGGGTAPDGNYYTNTCGYLGLGDTFWDVWFNDPDGDCVSSDWVAATIAPDGTYDHFTRDEDLRRNGNDPTINFNRWECCGPTIVVNGAGGECQWRYEPGVNGGIVLVCGSGESD